MKRWCGLLLLPLVASADERILEFDSDLFVRADATIEVTETIRVRAEGRQIRRGIYRDFPTRYRDRYGNRVVVDYEPQSVQRDGTADGLRCESLANGVRCYFGHADVFLDSGVYTYTFRYRAARMLGFFAGRDELYWNVTGSGWAFPIDSASATVRFGFELDDERVGVDAWTGPAGSTGKDYRATTSAATARFVATRPLAAGENLTIVVDWPKGHVAEPGDWQRVRWLLGDNRDLLVALAGLLALLAYYLPVWHYFGRDPAAGVTVVRYEPPAGFSPASLRYIGKMGYDSKTFTAAVVNLAVKGYLRIDNDGKHYSLVRTTAAATAALANGERELLNALFADRNGVLLDDEYHEIFSAARLAHQRSLRRDYRSRYFTTNGLMNLPAALLFLLTLVILFGPGERPAGLALVVLAASVIVMAVFAWLLKRPTGIGRRVLDETDGFREYLEIAEKDELNLRNPPARTPQLFETYLPYALALGVEQAWAERFSRLFAGLQREDGSPYHPSWYNGSWNSLDIGHHAASLSSGLTSAISSSMTPPGSSSGSGGSSGGGGGGGGGGGW